MTLETPVVTMGIGGTTVAGKAAVEEMKTVLRPLKMQMEELDKFLCNDGGTQVLAQVGATTSVSSFTAAPPAPIILSTQHKYKLTMVLL